jgi:hypothetical protein
MYREGIYCVHKEHVVAGVEFYSLDITAGSFVYSCASGKWRIKFYKGGGVGTRAQENVK